LYSCKEEPGFKCRKYHGNVKNYMNSVAIIETPAGVNRLYYLVTLISNVLYKNSAVDHQTLATYIHRLIEADHPAKTAPPGELPPEVTFGRNLIGFNAEQEERLQIATVQAKLLKLGYEVGEIDGKLGPRTKAAIKSFQDKQGLKADGKISAKLMKQLETAIGSMPPTDSVQPDPTTAQ
jgi:N-acetyl-anhydromuramyl-L-alanine amidase AmpD